MTDTIDTENLTKPDVMMKIIRMCLLHLKLNQYLREKYTAEAVCIN